MYACESVPCSAIRFRFRAALKRYTHTFGGAAERLAKSYAHSEVRIRISRASRIRHLRTNSRMWRSWSPRVALGAGDVPRPLALSTETDFILKCHRSFCTSCWHICGPHGRPQPILTPSRRTHKHSRAHTHTYTQRTLDSVLSAAPAKAPPPLQPEPKGAGCGVDVVASTAAAAASAAAA